ncbi:MULTISPECIES: ABC transporter ATP-binding protein [unclassified Pyramidobacter]|uniref:ABC transporter ATP-binding protein n=1 Tax=unclassified Pyramidobacter TaxID=2632171 RepID=UPI00098F038E|nr:MULTISPECIES: oligopeptide/dipeptide ABC transporter ATP-binding protein [unclassified Pyramidobacter]MCI7403361.1 ATP-binding cassette domain-containing protein [Pyramidobacter sp.]MDY3212517.1 oligopeptide/dipeptide ABC transporter ATP-binding protein [Pyramidobacter sp.]OON89168.1 peptide ABC transporter ATP-binding protein [Pyramidobacter sp. C12-8]WOL40866.1 ATP-binding cassette domain-containing protein [Pyramidobacter sp. YE332]
MSDNLIEIKHLKKYFHVSSGLLHAVDDVSLDIPRGKTLGLVGESGCGKSTLGRVIIGLLKASGGEVFFNGEDSLKFDGAKRSEFRRHAQIVFQDPFSSLNPRMSVSQLISEPLIINGICRSRKELDEKVGELMDLVGLASRLTTSFPHELDGGRRQRIGIARALALDPEFIVLDEPVSALDVCIQAQVLNLLADLREQRGYTYLFISHNLSVVRYVSDEVAVMYLGNVVEKADNSTLFKSPLHPYTQALLSAVPIASVGPKKQRIILEGDVPSPVNPPEGCRFAGRCWQHEEICTCQTPPLVEVEPGHFVACHRLKDQLVCHV